ncbi:hypothetical protein CROQUDRAFT_702275 [Cronartium quercuum f. sp. fusiforme G11]|uniref:Tc1-like transposase DDE domain-containing protein n=1 Tax=Cronartium quercuum f. sp. fusiforme G11 TaxID=708437 RepID=A0A9P6TC80_9BASI|nr:hypothetical protein CROQUDRAFT_702275 [Cronartium quercuum f. sp. fusiforme G11]
MLELIDRAHTLYLDEIQIHMFHETDISACLGTIARDLKLCLKLSLKKACTVHLNRCPDKHADYFDNVSGLPPEMLVFLDELAYCTCARRSGTPSSYRKSTLAVTSQEGTVLRTHFKDVLEVDLLPKMKPYASENLVLIIDNALIHQGEGG